VSDQTVPLEAAPLNPAMAVGDSASVLLNLSTATHKLQVRGKPANTDFLSGFEKAVNLSLPCQPNTTNRTSGRAVFWLGPDEWLVRLDREDPEPSGVFTAEEHLMALQDCLKGVHSSVVDVSDYYLVFELSGPRAPQVLEKVTPLDVLGVLPDLEFCAQTRMGTAAVLINRVSDLDTYQIQVRRSFTEYLWEYLSEAAAEFL